MHYYPTIGLTSKSDILIKEVNDILEAMNFKTSVRYNVENYDKRTNQTYTKSTLELNGVENLNLWIDKIGFNSSKHLTKHILWKKYGFCPANTNIKQRLDILNDKIDISSFYV